MATHGQGLGLTALAVAATAWLTGAAATMAGEEPRPLPVRLIAADTQLRVAAETARVLVRHEFEALADAPAGGKVAVPLPTVAAVEDLRLTFDGRSHPTVAHLGVDGIASVVPPVAAGRRFVVEVVYSGPAASLADGGRSLALPAPAGADADAAFTLSAVLADPMQAVDSPSHRIVGAATAAGGTWLTLRDGAVPADRPFVLEWRPAQVAAGS